MNRDDVKNFRDYVIVPTLHHLKLFSDAACNLLLGTAMAESRLVAVKQHGRGPAVGRFQMEPATWDDLYKNFLTYRPELRARVNDLVISSLSSCEQMAGNDYYACAMARLAYYRRPEALPAADDVEGLAAYWKKWYNTPLGAGDPVKWANLYRAYAP